MENRHQEKRLKCPFCRFESRDFDTFDRHVQRFHADEQRKVDNESQPDAPRQPQNPEPELNDFELAQLLAFEEAGLPSELALPDRPNVPARHDLQAPEVATKPAVPPPDSQSGGEEPWVDCVCGERVHFLELDAHSDMHAQEDISMDEADLTSNVELSSLRPTAEQPLNNISNSFSTDIPKPLRNYDQLHPQTPPSNHKRQGPSLKDIFLGSPSSPKRKSPYPAVSHKQGKTRRLGVRISEIQQLEHI